MSQDRQKPVHEIRLGRIRATIWAIRTENGRIWLNTTVSRAYYDGAQWKDANSYGRDDLPVLAKVLDLAYAWIWRHELAVDSDEAAPKA
jgi:hypothetical protein